MATAEDFKILCEKIADSRNFKFCPGISLEEYERCKQVIGYDPKNVRIIDVPIKRIESVKCEHWFPLSRGRTTKEKQQASELLCRECIKLQQYLASSVRRLSGVTPEKHQQADSCYPMKYLSPQSLQRRKLNIKSVRAKEKRMLRKYVPKEIILDKERAEKRQLHVNFITGEKNNIIE